MDSEKIGKVLIVDDETIIRNMLKIELEHEYDVYTSENAENTFNILDKTPIDLIISDINMPGIKGYDLIKIVKEKYPNTKTALITAYDINDYIRMAKENDITNIISKSTPFNFDEFKSIVRNLVTEKIFGLEQYMLTDFKVLGEYSILDSSKIGEVEDNIIEIISKFHRGDAFVNILLEELITNAIYHAPVNKNGEEKYSKHSNVVLEESEAVEIYLGKDSEKYGVSVMDTSGKLTKQEVLYRIDRHIHGEGLLDEEGRGLHMSRIYSDRLIINLKKNEATEAIFMNYIDQKYSGFKSLYINEI